MPWLEDLKSLFEVWIVAAVVFWWLPSRIFRERPGRNAFLRFCGGLSRMALLTVIAAVVLSALHILNAGTLIALYTLMFLAYRMRHNRNRTAWRERFLSKVAWSEEWYQNAGWKRPFGVRWQVIFSPQSAHMLPVMGAGIVVLLLVAQVRLWWPLHYLRFAYSDAYVQLLRIRELLHDTKPFSQPLVLPSILAAVSSLAAVDAMQVMRFLPPLLDVLLALGGGIAMAAVFRNNWVGVFTTFILGGYTEISVLSQGGMGTFFLLLGLAFLGDYYYHSNRANLYDAICAFALLALSLPQPFPLETTVTLLLSCLLGFVARLADRWAPAYRLGALLPLLLMTGVFIGTPPTYPRPNFLEYEATARQSLRIASTFPKQHWAIAAPNEQFAETFGLGQYEDLYQFVNHYQDQVTNPEFRFPYETLFVFVEKHPFQYFASEPKVVSFSILTDPTYRNYRSPAGRSSIEMAAMRLCERYAEVHPSRIFYEDQDLKIYQFSRD